jgi:hypothetical protein
MRRMRISVIFSGGKICLDFKLKLL